MASLLPDGNDVSRSGLQAADRSADGLVAGRNASGHGDVDLIETRAHDSRIRYRCANAADGYQYRVYRGCGGSYRLAVQTASLGVAMAF